MSLCDIEIIGPGLIINGRALVVQEALEKYGFTVKVKNKHPEENPTIYLENFKQRKDNGDVNLIVKHMPWGG